MSKDDRELIELKPCPFCGEDMTVMATWISNAPDSAEAMEAPVCPCGAQGPMYPTRRLAANAWNIRAATRLEALQAQPVGEGVRVDFRKMINEAAWSCNAKIAKPVVDAIIQKLKAANDAAALTASPPVVEREAIAKEFVDHFRDAVGEDAWLSVPQYLQTWIMGKAGAVHLALSTPVAQGDEVRDAERQQAAWDNAFEQAPDRAQCIDIFCHSCGWCSINQKCSREVANIALATLTKGARDAG